MKKMVTLFVVLALNILPVNAGENPIWESWLNIPAVHELLPRVPFNGYGAEICKDWTAAQKMNHLINNDLLKLEQPIQQQLCICKAYGVQINSEAIHEVDIADPPTQIGSYHYYAVPITDTNCVLIEKDFTVPIAGGGIAKFVTLRSIATDLGDGRYLY